MFIVELNESKSNPGLESKSYYLFHTGTKMWITDKKHSAYLFPHQDAAIEAWQKWKETINAGWPSNPFEASLVPMSESQMEYLRDLAFGETLRACGERKRQELTAAMESPGCHSQEWLMKARREVWLSEISHGKAVFLFDKERWTIEAKTLFSISWRHLVVECQSTGAKIKLWRGNGKGPVEDSHSWPQPEERYSIYETREQAEYFACMAFLKSDRIEDIDPKDLQALWGKIKP